jgi:hypothetical protein
MAGALDPLLGLLHDPRTASESVSTVGILDGAASVYLWGRSPAVVSSVLYSLARRVDPGFAWLELRDRSSVDPVDRLLASDPGRPRSNTIAFRPQDLAPGPLPKPAALSWLVAVDESPAELDRFRDFLALPEVLQEVVGRPVGPGAPRVLAIPHADLLADLLSGSLDALRTIARILKSAAVSIMIGQTARNTPLRDWFDYVFEVRADGLESWPEGSLVCERTPNRGAAAEGLQFPLRRLSWATDVLSAARELSSR